MESRRMNTTQNTMTLRIPRARSFLPDLTSVEDGLEGIVAGNGSPSTTSSRNGGSIIFCSFFITLFAQQGAAGLVMVKKINGSIIYIPILGGSRVAQTLGDRNSAKVYFNNGGVGVPLSIALITLYYEETT